MSGIGDRCKFRTWARRNPGVAWSTFRWGDIPPHRQRWFREQVFPRHQHRQLTLTILGYRVDVQLVPPAGAE